eukprot:4623563-Alexandrium_andersonii.AAC.1
MAAESGGPLARQSWGPVRYGPELPPPEGWWIATDGSGGGRAEGVKAGWGAVIFRWPVRGMSPDW